MNHPQKINPKISFSEEVLEAIENGRPVVALESTVITHGLPHPENLVLAGEGEAEIRGRGAVPATIAVVAGEVIVGASADQLEFLSHGKEVRKLSSRDLASAIARHESGGTTVAGTAFIAHQAGIRVFATGGIGGVHRGNPFDISADLVQLSRTPVIVVCAGAKAILDLAATVEVLETLGIPVIGYQTADFPAFYSVASGLRTASMADSAQEIANIAQAHWGLGMDSAVLVALPPPSDAALPIDSVEKAIVAALESADILGIRGQAVTPYLLERVNSLTSGASLQTNLALLKNNARLAAEIAIQLPRS